jgi:hypothetical protein
LVFRKVIPLTFLAFKKQKYTNLFSFQENKTLNPSFAPPTAGPKNKKARRPFRVLCFCFGAGYFGALFMSQIARPRKTTLGNQMAAQ